MALQIEAPPRTASVVADPTPFEWSDARWLQAARATTGSCCIAPLSIYEVHAGSWRRLAEQGWRR